MKGKRDRKGDKNQKKDNRRNKDRKKDKRKNKSKRKKDRISEAVKYKEKLEKGEILKREIKRALKLSLDLIKKEGIAKTLGKEILSLLYRYDKDNILKLINSYNPSLREAVMFAVEKNLDKSALEKLIKNKDRDVRKFAIDMAYRIGDIELLQVGLEDKDKVVYSASAEYLSQLGEREFADKIFEKMKNEEDEFIKLLLIESLINLEHKDVWRFVDREKYGDTFIRALGASGSIEALYELIKIFIQEPHSRGKAFEEIIKIIRKIPDIEKIKSKVLEITNYLSEREREILSWILK